MTNVHARKCIVRLKTMAALVFSAELDEKSQSPQQTRVRNAALCESWHQLLDYHNPMMTTLHQHEDFSDEEMDALHKLSNAIFGLWVDLFAEKKHNITHHTHIIGAGYLHHCPMKHRNPHRFSQQGWEAMDQKLKHFHFNATNHGGC